MSGFQSLKVIKTDSLRAISFLGSFLGTFLAKSLPSQLAVYDHRSIPGEFLDIAVSECWTYCMHIRTVPGQFLDTILNRPVAYVRVFIGSFHSMKILDN